MSFYGQFIHSSSLSLGYFILKTYIFQIEYFNSCLLAQKQLTFDVKCSTNYETFQNKLQVKLLQNYSATNEVRRALPVDVDRYLYGVV